MYRGLNNRIFVLIKNTTMELVDASLFLKVQDTIAIKYTSNFQKIF